jgi:transcriptional regulator with XRE-family HTH domain
MTNLSKEISSNDTLGARLYAERSRLGLSQTEMGKLGGVVMSTYRLYEANSRNPDSEFLGKLYVAGVDVLYVLTGVRNSSELTNEQSAVLTALGQLDERARKAAVAAVLCLVQTYNSD